MIAWLYPAFLGALALLAVPIVLHLLHRDVPRRVVFPTVRFLLKDLDPRQGRRGLSDLLTLLARLALLALAVALFAQPVRREPAAAGGPGAAAGQVAVVVDVSASLNAVDFARWCPAAVERLVATHPGATFGLVASANRVELTVAPTADPAPVRAAAARLRPTVRPGRHDAGLEAASALFDGARPGPRFLYLLTDLQRQDWASSDLSRLERQATVRIVQPPVPAAGLDNLAVMAVRHESFGQARGRRVRATVEVRNFGLTAHTGRLTLRTGTRSVTREIAVRGEATERFVIDSESPDSPRAAIELAAADAYALDDRYLFWIGPRPQLTAGIVAAKTAAKETEAFFLRQALTTEQTGYDSYEATPLPADFLLTGEAFRGQCLFLLDAAGDLSRPETERLRAWVEGGGYLVYFCDRASDDGLDVLRRAGLTGLAFRGFQGEVNQWHVFNVGSRRPDADVVAPFAGEPADLFTFPIYKYCRLAPPAGDEPLLKLGNGDPFLTEETRGRGRVYVFATSLQPAWSELPTSLSFVPLVRRIMETCNAAHGFGVLSVEAGEDPTPRLAALGLKLTAPVPEAPGIVMAGEHPLEVNLTRAESDLRRLTDAELGERTLAGGTPAVTGERTRGPERELALGPYCAAGLLGLAFLELLAANLGWRRRPS